MLTRLAAQINGLQVTVTGMTVVFVALTGLCMVLVSLWRFLPDKGLSAHAPQDEAPVELPSVTKEGAVEPIPEPATRPHPRVPTVVDPRIQAVVAAQWWMPWITFPKTSSSGG